MGAIARRFISRISPAFWLAAVALTAALTVDPRLHVLGWVIISTGFGATGEITGAIGARQGHDNALLLGALLANRPPHGGDGQEQPARDRLRAV